MFKKLCTFSVLSFLIFAGHESLAIEYQNPYQRKNFYKDNKQECVCSCHDRRSFCGLQIFGSGSLILAFKNCEVSAARFIHPNLYSFFDAFQQNKKLVENSTANYYKECFSTQPAISKYLGFSTGLRYLWGGNKSGYGFNVLCGKRKLFDLTLKTNAVNQMDDFFKTNVGKENKSKIQNIQTVRNKLDKISSNKGDNFYQIPESISCSSWHVDALFEFYHCFIGDMLKTEEQQREKFCLLGFLGLGTRVLFNTKVSDNIYSVAPKENVAFVKKNKLPLYPLLELGLQCLFKNGYFFELSFLTQCLYIPFLIPIPIPFSTFGMKDLSSVYNKMMDDRSSITRNDFWFLLNVSPEIKISFGYDFYGLCVGKKLEDYYDN